MRKYRELSDVTKQKISQSLKGKRHNEEQKQRISQSMKKYWQTIPNKPTLTTCQSNEFIKNNENNKRKDTITDVDF